MSSADGLLASATTGRGRWVNTGEQVAVDYVLRGITASSAPSRRFRSTFMGFRRAAWELTLGAHSAFGRNWRGDALDLRQLQLERSASAGVGTTVQLPGGAYASIKGVLATSRCGCHVAACGVDTGIGSDGGRSLHAAVTCASPVSPAARRVELRSMQASARFAYSGGLAAPSPTSCRCIQRLALESGHERQPIS